MTIPFHKPCYDERDEQSLITALRSGSIVGDASSTRRAAELFAGILGVKHLFLTTSCTHALELAMMVLRVKQGDEVIVPSFTFVSSTNCIIRQGARVVFAEIDPQTLTIDPDDVAARVTPRTRTIIPVLYAGVTPDLDRLMPLVRERNIVVVEDAAQGVGAEYRGRPAGTTGDIGCFSFHETKNLTTGEGGAFVTNNDAYASTAEIIREKGTNRRQFLEGLVDKYTWVDVGSSFLPSDLTGALLISQLEKREGILRAREAIYRRYLEDLAPLASAGHLTLPTIPPGVRSNYHIFHVLMADETTRNRALTFFRNRNIGTTFHYLPLHLSTVGRELGYHAGDFPVTESVSGRLLRLPIYPSLSESEQAYVIETMQDFCRQ
jgi:dTDP-4-amino-4,6-dideoxygalactose transaminase